MKQVLSEIREVRKTQLWEINLAFDKVPDGKVPDVSDIVDRYEPRLQELGQRVREIVRSRSS